MGIAEYIREQPDVIRRVFADVPGRVQAVAGELPRRPRAVALVGSGTSRHALLSVEGFLARQLGCPVQTIGPMDLMADPPPWAGDGALALLLSQSGASTTTAQAVTFARDRSMAVLAVTAEARSAVADAGAPVVVMPVGPEPVGPKTKGYAGSVTTLLCVGLVLAGASDWRALQAEVDATCEAIAGAMEGWDAAATALAGRHRRAGYLMLVAQGRHLGTAHEGALKITEMSGIPAGAFDLEEALHGRFHALDATTPALLLARSGPERETARAAGATLGALGVPHQVIAVGDAGGELDVRLPALRALPELDLLPAVVPLQWLARALAIARGMAPEAMRYPGLSARLGIKTPADAD